MLSRLVVLSFATLFVLLGCDTPNTAVFNADGSSSANGEMRVSFSSTRQVAVPSNVDVFMLSGSCSSGRYPTTVISWFLQTTSGQVVFDSYSAGGQYFTSTCVSDRFNLTVRVPCPGAVNSGGGCYGLMRSYLLRARIVGLTADGAQPLEAQATSSPVNLVPGGAYAAAAKPAEGTIVATQVVDKKLNKIKRQGHGESDRMPASVKKPNRKKNKK